MIRFTATIETLGINPCIQIPARVTRYFGKRGYVPVTVYLQSGEVPSSLVPIGGGVQRLYINAAMLRCTDSRIGDRVSIGLELDASDRSLKAPDHLLGTLSARPLAESRWKSLAPSKRKEIIRYISTGKSNATRNRNVARLLRILESKSGAGVLCGIRITDRRDSRLTSR